MKGGKEGRLHVGDFSGTNADREPKSGELRTEMTGGTYLSLLESDGN